MASVDQICFTGESNCTSFSGHMLKANICTNCMKDISKHSKDAVKETDLAAALEFTQKGEMFPSLILEKVDDLGQLYLGGFKAIVNEEFVRDAKIKGVVNTVGPSLFAVFGKKFESRYKNCVSEYALEILEVEWQDNLKYDITDDDLTAVLRHIHRIRSTGGSVVVHCAQGKSRSTTAVVAYIMALKNISLNEALDIVKNKRKMAEPNPHFMYLLNQFEKSELKARLYQQFTKEE